MDVVACTFLISRLSFSKSYTLRNLQGDDTEVPVIPTIGEEVTSKGAKKATLRGPGVDERYGSLLYLMEPTRSITFAVSATLRVSKYLSLPFSITISIREFPTLFASIHALFMRVISLIVSNYSSFFFISVIRIPAFLTSSCLHYFVSLQNCNYWFRPVFWRRFRFPSKTLQVPQTAVPSWFLTRKTMGWIGETAEIKTSWIRRIFAKNLCF